MRKTEPDVDVVDIVSLQDLCRFCQADEAWVVELVEHGVLNPSGTTIQSWRFRGLSIVRAKKARRLNQDLGINAAGIAMVLDLLDQRDAILRKLP
ncbi:hypothetical protein C1J03_03890 [Sulfitobacter sp. SK012]|uniref:chaperone modulator CbpM n=1 Tax=Sulfitobacter sp. SK012 TaxID=1389005 RepID=UPI000E0A8F88|nr:chaperone modulator CbpM [Sulfitobacter sp. SK012]AXI45249.1 hypothetical protein C1J03_03890 [Sulfitobacter sp. SK012]